VNSVVCLKQVPDTEAAIKINPEKTGIITEGIKYVANPYDEYAVEEALKLKERFGQGKVTVISMGPDRIMESIRTFLAMGADEAIHLKDEAFMGADCYATALALAAAIKAVPFDIVLMGRIAIDDQSMQVGAYLSEMLQLPIVQVVTKLDVAEDKKSARATRQIEGGNEVVEVRLPAVITAQKGLNEPRYASLPGIMKARKKAVAVKTAADLGLTAGAVGLAGSKTKVVLMSSPPGRARGKILEGEPPVAAQKLVKALREEAKVV
jgi:electron transfer flavoprotein beta subunit